MDELSATAADLQPDFILLTESWTNSNVPDASLSIPGYGLELRKDRDDTGRGVGGGLLVYAKEGRKILSDDSYDRVGFNQMCCFKTTLEGGQLTIILIYRPPSSGEENTDKLCEVLRNVPINTIVIGDFNMPKIRWDDHTSDSRARRLVETMEEENLDQLVSFPTHVKGNILDLVVTNCSNKIISVEDVGRLGKSDHCILMTEIDIAQEGKCQAEVRHVWRRANWTAMKLLLRQIRWQNILLKGTVDDAWNALIREIENIVDMCVPMAKVNHNNRPRWLSRELLILIRKKRQAWKAFKNHGTYENLEKYKKLEKDVVKKVRNAKRGLEKDIAENKDKNNKKFTNYIKTKTKSKLSIGPLKINGKTITDEIELANHLNTFFASVFTVEELSTLPTVRHETNSRLERIEITREDIRNTVKKLRAGSAAGPDNIHPQLLKELREELIEPLEIIFTRSIREGRVPEKWREATVIPIFKKGSKGEAGNYRPVSLTSVPCKVMETIVKDKLVEHLEENNLIRTSQHGFLKGKSCATNLIVFMDKLTKILDKNSKADIFYLDFAKAFDKVAHGRLMIKLESKGVGGEVLAWIRDWLTNRKQRVKVGKSSSGEAEVRSGIPQGTVLGPPLFIIYIDDIDEATYELDLLLKFADNTKGVQEINSEDDNKKLQKTLDGLVAWANKWAMSFNVNKCKILHIGNNNPKHKYFMNGVELEATEQEKDIGVLVSSTLKPTKQCQKAAATAGAVLRQITKNFHYRDRKIFKNLYCQYVRPHLEFATAAWSPWLATDIDLIEQVQKRAVNMMVGLKGASYEEKCAEIDIEPLKIRREHADLIQVFKILHGYDEMAETLLFERSSVVTAIPTRQRSDPLNLKIPRARLDIRKFSFAARVVNGWNALDPKTKNMPSVKQFKMALKQMYRRRVVGAAAE